MMQKTRTAKGGRFIVILAAFLFSVLAFDSTLGYPGEGPPRTGQADERGTRRPHEACPESSQSTSWSISAPTGRHIALCATCCSDITSRMPRVRRGDVHGRVHHVGCVAAQCGPPQLLGGWGSLDSKSQAVAVAHYEGSPAGDGPAAREQAQEQVDASMSSGDHASRDAASPAEAGPEERILQRMEFWDHVPWAALHDPTRSIDSVPNAVKGPLADLRGSLAAAAQRSAGCVEEENYLKAFFFLDRLMFAASRKQRGGARGQRGETVARTIGRRLRAAWAGSWGALWEESNAAHRAGAGFPLSAAQRLARDIKSIEEALADDDMREALRCADAKMQMADDRKARRCLPALFPQAASQPVIEDREPQDEDVERFLRELRSAYRFAPQHRACGPGSGRNEHWSWMPRYEESWDHVEKVLLRLALAKLPAAAMQAVHSARVLAADRDEADKVRPLALGMIHRRLTSKAAGRVFQARVSAAVAPREHSIGKKGGAELMHKTVLVDLDSRDDAVKLSFDASNAHNEYDRAVAAQCVRDDVPDLLPWVRGALSIEATHQHVGMDGTRTYLRKTRGGDQGDALTALIFPLTYKPVADAVQAAATEIDPKAHVFTYQDDMEGICVGAAVTPAAAAYDAACSRAGLRANFRKTRATPGRGVDPTSLPEGLIVDAKAVVLRHSDCTPVPAIPAESHANGSQLAEGSIEVRNLGSKRQAFSLRLRNLRAAGLSAHSSLAMLRARTAGDYVFVARACGIPAREASALDGELQAEVARVMGHEWAGHPARRRVFVQSGDGGLGFQSIFQTSPVAYAASWHACMPAILKHLGLQSVSALTSLSPWASVCLPVATEALQTALDDHSVCIGDEGVAASQHILAKAPHAAAAKLIADEVATDNKASAALRSAGGPGAAVWMNAASLPNQHLSDAQFVIAMRTRLHLALPHCTGPCQHRKRDGSICEVPLDDYGFHARCCPCGGWLSRRHDQACAVLGSWCEEMGCQLQAGQKPWGEVVVPWAAPRRPEARMDLVVHAPGIALPFYIDLTVVSCLSTEALSGGSAVRDGAAAAIAARGKVKDYPSCSVTPFVIEDHGRLGEDALRLIRTLAPVDPADRSKAIRRIHQSLGATLQRCAAEAVIAATTTR